MTLSLSERESLLRALPRHALILTGAAFALWGFHLFAPILATGWILAAWLLVAWVMAIGLFRRHRLRRRAWLRAYVHEESRWQWRLRGGWLMALRHAVVALALAGVLLLVLVRTRDEHIWQALALSLVVLLAVRTWVHARLQSQLQRVFRPEAVWRVTLWLSGLLLLGALVALAFQRPQPDFTEASLSQAIWHLVDRQQARSEWLQQGLQALAAKEALQLWLAQHLSTLPATQWPMQLLVWGLVFVEQALFVLAWLWVFVGVLSGVEPDALVRRHD